jgi:hypothetical protein
MLRISRFVLTPLSAFATTIDDDSRMVTDFDSILGVEIDFCGIGGRSDVAHQIDVDPNRLAVALLRHDEMRHSSPRTHNGIMQAQVPTEANAAEHRFSQM